MTINTSDLDFYNIKSKLKTHFRNSGEFEDYDFDASGLSNILDVLAYNTHINGLIANMSINESFLSTSQLRSSVVSHAESLGYFPSSETAARAVVDVTINIPTAAPSTFTLPKGSHFFTSIDESSFDFFTDTNYTVFNDGSGNFVFSGVSLLEGKRKTKTFLADKNIDVPYVIPDSTIDTSTLVINVFPNGTTGLSYRYLNVKEVATITEESRVYMVRESMNGNYEILFGDGNVLGQRPQTGNIISVEYVSTSGVDGNGGDEFFLNEFSGSEYGISVNTVSVSAGGSSKESTSQIKLNAPLAFSTQNRLVTADDYTGLIKSNYGSYLRDVSTWGGNDNVPPQYGKVFVSLNYADGVDESSKLTIESLISNQLTSNLSIMSIDTVFIEPETTFLELNTVFNIDPIKNTTTPEALKSDVEDIIANYTNQTLSTFEASFRRSNLLSKIDEHSTAILNSRMTVRLQQRIDVDTILSNLNTAKQALNPPLPIQDFLEQDHTINFPVVLASPDSDDHVITTSVFKWNGQNVYIKNELGSTRLQLLDVNNLLKISNVGSYDPAKGTVYLSAVRIDENGYLTGGIRVSATPANQSTIAPLRNYILTLDADASLTESRIESGETKVLL